MGPIVRELQRRFAMVREDLVGEGGHVRMAERITTARTASGQAIACRYTGRHGRYSF